MTCIPVGDRMGLYFLLQSAAKAIKMAMAVDRLGNIMKNSGAAAIFITGQSADNKTGPKP